MAMKNTGMLNTDLETIINLFDSLPESLINKKYYIDILLRIVKPELL